MDVGEAKGRFERTYGAARLNLEGVGEDQALRTPGEAGNSINWILGHILAYRTRMLSMLGAEPPADPDVLRAYTGGGEREWTPEVALPLERLLGLLDRSQKQLSAALEEAGRGEPSALSDGADLGFFHFHEAYHVGQLGLARRCLGLPGAIEPSDAPRGG